MPNYFRVEAVIINHPVFQRPIVVELAVSPENLETFTSTGNIKDFHKMLGSLLTDMLDRDIEDPVYINKVNNGETI